LYSRRRLHTCPSKRDTHKNTHFELNSQNGREVFLHLYPRMYFSVGNNRSERRLNVDWSGERLTERRGERSRIARGSFFFLQHRVSLFEKHFFSCSVLPDKCHGNQMCCCAFFFSGIKKSEILWKGFLFTKEENDEWRRGHLFLSKNASSAFI